MNDVLRLDDFRAGRPSRGRPSRPSAWINVRAGHSFLHHAEILAFESDVFQGVAQPEIFRMTIRFNKVHPDDLGRVISILRYRTGVLYGPSHEATVGDVYKVVTHHPPCVLTIRCGPFRNLQDEDMQFRTNACFPGHVRLFHGNDQSSEFCVEKDLPGLPRVAFI